MPLFPCSNLSHYYNLHETTTLHYDENLTFANGINIKHKCLVHVLGKTKNQILIKLLTR